MKTWDGLVRIDRTLLYINNRLSLERWRYRNLMRDEQTVLAGEAKIRIAVLVAVRKKLQRP